MKREEVEKFIEEEYAVLPDYLWKDDHITGALRHPNSKKWFGILMRISARRLDINTDGSVDIINVKLDPDFIQVLLRDKLPPDLDEGVADLAETASQDLVGKVGLGLGLADDSIESGLVRSSQAA